MGRAWIVVILGLLAAASVHAVEVHDVRLWRAPDHTRIVFDLTGPAEHRLIVLENPGRIVLDIERTSLRAAVDGLSLDDTPVARIRSGIREGRNLRVVLDMTAEVEPRSFALQANAQAGDRLVLDLYDKSVQPVAAAKKSVRQAADARRDIIVAIDAGHGGEDPGALGPRRLREKDVCSSDLVRGGCARKTWCWPSPRKWRRCLPRNRASNPP